MQKQTNKFFYFEFAAALTVLRIEVERLIGARRQAKSRWRFALFARKIEQTPLDGALRVRKFARKKRRVFGESNASNAQSYGGAGNVDFCSRCCLVCGRRRCRLVIKIVATIPASVGLQKKSDAAAQCAPPARWTASRRSHDCELRAVRAAACRATDAAVVEYAALCRFRPKSRRSSMFRLLQTADFELVGKRLRLQTWNRRVQRLRPNNAAAVASSARGAR